MHVDFSVTDLDIAVAHALAASAVQKGKTSDLSYGRQAMVADPFGNGFCPIEFK